MTAPKTRRVVRKDTAGGVTDTAIVTWFREFVGIKDQVKTLTSRQNEVKDRLKDAVESRGYRDSDGHFWFDLPEEIGGFTKLKRERRVSQSFDTEAALELARSKGLKKCIRTIEVLDEDAFAAAVYTGDITKKEMEALKSENVTYAFVPRAK